MFQADTERPGRAVVTARVFHLESSSAPAYLVDYEDELTPDALRLSGPNRQLTDMGAVLDSETGKLSVRTRRLDGKFWVN